MVIITHNKSYHIKSALMAGKVKGLFIDTSSPCDVFFIDHFAHGVH